MKRKKLEKDIERSVVDFAEKYNILVTKLNLIGRRNFPDRVFWLPGGKPLLIEFKRPGERVNEGQAQTIARLRRLGYNVEVTDDAEEGKQFIRRFQASALGADAAPQDRGKVLTSSKQRRTPARPRNAKDKHKS